jgi:cholinesterase
MCPQPVRHFTNDVNQSEDCLFLNIWTVSSQNNRSNGDLKAVMVYIHGGGFIVGSSFQFPDSNGTALASHDLTIVTINYRLGFLGFTYGGVESAPGNVGLLDQMLALEWVVINKHF